MKSEMYNKINQSTAYKKSKITVCNFAIKNNENLSELIAIAFDTTHENHIKAFWSLELVSKNRIKLLVPYLDSFCKILPLIKEDSALRPATKICLFLAKSNNRKNGIELTKDQEHNLIEALIDRLIQNEKVAAKVYAMKALFFLGKKYNWIYEELKPIITQDAFNHSAAYQTCARNILKKI
ncbi:hypothetical protein [uncultured Flavobacterium sp.]|uniref:hypothetical protein n=1 Tax=uncultured Flavobacterium sp. TaxID=165435 RepID=UPI0030CA418B|tara:strand:- start:440 stop:982 length:543 start_codon:yes stop_codon:yes gene_type:complete